MSPKVGVSQNVRSRRAQARDGTDNDFDSVLAESRDSDSMCGPRQRVVLGALCLCQLVLLFCFAHISWQKRQQEPLAQTTGRAGCAVRILTDESLPSFVAGMPNGTLLSFHSPGCKFCEEVHPEFENAACELQAKAKASGEAAAPELAFVSVASAPKAVAKYGVERYPAMIWFRNGERVAELPPTSMRTSAAIVEYVEWLRQPSVWAFTSRSDFMEAVPQLRSALRRGSPPVIVGFAGTSLAHTTQMRTDLEATGERFRGKMVFLFVEEPATNAGGDRGDAAPALRAYFSVEEDDKDFEGSFSMHGIQDWVKQIWQSANVTLSEAFPAATSVSP